MADFKTHVQFSTITGIVYGAGLYLLGVPTPTSAIASGICAMAGMIPDIDSKSSKALQECLYIMAGLVSVHVLTRLSEFPINRDIVLLVGVASFIFTKAGLGEIVKKHTKHRGLMHSIPMAILAGEITYLFSAGDVASRILKAVALFLGFMSHLVLDEIYSVDVRGARVKKSFGTALKVFNSATPYRSIFIYGLIIVSGYLLTHESRWSEELKTEAQRLANIGIAKLEKYSDNAYTDTIIDEWNHMYWWYMSYHDPDYLDAMFGDEEHDETDNYDNQNSTQIAGNENSNYNKTVAHEEQDTVPIRRRHSWSPAAAMNRYREKETPGFPNDNSQARNSTFGSRSNSMGNTESHATPFPTQKTNDNYTRPSFSREATPRHAVPVTPRYSSQPPSPSPQQQQQGNPSLPLPASRTSVFSRTPSAPILSSPQNTATNSATPYPAATPAPSPGNGKLIRSFSPLAPR